MLTLHSPLSLSLSPLILAKLRMLLLKWLDPVKYRTANANNDLPGKMSIHRERGRSRGLLDAGGYPPEPSRP